MKKKIDNASDDTIHRSPWGSFTSKASSPSATVGDGRPRVPASVVCKYVGVHRRTLARWVEDKEISFPRPYVLCGRWSFDPQEVEDWMEGHRVVAAAERARKAAFHLRAEKARAKAAEKRKKKQPVRRSHSHALEVA
jgi:excisionase family DNA binding protein